MRNLAAAVVLVVVLAGALGAYQLFGSGGTGGTGCGVQPDDKGTKFRAPAVVFGAVTVYCLPGPSRFANGMASAPDGSVWFGEQSVPGVAHLYANGTVVEYRWPGAPESWNGSYRTGIWGMALWEGRVWGSDFDGNRIVGLDPSTGTYTVLNVSVPHSFPYALVPGPDGALWFTMLANTPYLGRVAPNLSVSIRPLTSPPKQVPAEVQFSEDGTGYFAALDFYNASDTGVYSFRPGGAGTIAATRVGGGAALFDIDSLALGEGAIWAAQHSTSNIASLNQSTGRWTFYPTSTVNYTDVTLPYFVRTQGATVWFNEHYGNKIGRLDPGRGTLTEYSESDPAAKDVKGIQNDLTIATSLHGLWFTSASGGYVGYVDGTASPPFSVGVEGVSNRLAIAPGESRSVHFSVTGAWSKPLAVTVSDSERRNAFPNLISLVPDRTSVQAGEGPATVGLNVTAAGNLAPGSYVAALTLSDGLVFQTAYVFIEVT